MEFYDEPNVPKNISLQYHSVCEDNKAPLPIATSVSEASTTAQYGRYSLQKAEASQHHKLVIHLLTSPLMKTKSAIDEISEYRIAGKFGGN